MSKHPSDLEGLGNRDEMALLYQLGIALASGRDLFTTLLTLQTEILKLIPADAFYVAIYDPTTDIVEYPIHFIQGEPVPEFGSSRRLREQPGLTGAVISSGTTLYLPDMMTEDVLNHYQPIDDDQDFILHTFLGIPLIVNQNVIGVLSVQSQTVDAYTADQIRFMENIGVQATVAIDKSRLLDQLKQELDERKKMETDLRQRESILEAVAFAAEQFLKTSNWRLNIDTVLERFGVTMHVTHAYLFEDSVDAEGNAITSMSYEWTAPGFRSDLDDPYFKNSKIDAPGYEEQVAALRRGDVRVGTVSTFNPIEKDAMESLGVKALLEVPVFINQKTWGAIGFDDFVDERKWTNAEIDALKIAAGVLAAAIQRQKSDAAVQESERIYRQAIEAADAVPYFYDYITNGYLFVGEGIRAMTGYGPDEISPVIWAKLIKETIPLGSTDQQGGLEVSDPRLKRKIQAWKRDQKIVTRDGETRWITDRSVQVLDDRNVAQGSIGILQDITDRKATEEGLRKRESMLQAITFSAEQFLKSSNWREKINVVLEKLGREFESSHAYLFEHHPNLTGAVVASMTYEWTAPGFTSDIGSPSYTNSHPLREGEESSDDFLKKGEVFIGNIYTYPAIEKQRLTELGIKAIIELPIIVNGNWWGTLGLDDMSIVREWNPAEVDALKIAAGVLSATIQRQETESAVQESERIYRQAIEGAGAVPYYQDYELRSYTFIGQSIRDITGYLPEELSPAIWETMVLYSEPLGDLAGLTMDEAIQRVREGNVKVWRCDYQILSKDGRIRWISDSAVDLFGDTGASYGSIGIMQDITERKRVESDLRQRESLLKALTFSAEQFLKTSNWRETIDLVLEKLGREFNISHAYLFERHKSSSGENVSSMTYEWTAPGFNSDLNDPEYQNLALQEAGFERFYDVLDSGEPLAADNSFLDEFERKYLESIGVKALLEIRVIVDGEQWGTLGFDEVANDRIWTAAEIDVVKVAASMLGAAIKRQRDESTLQTELEQRKDLIAELESKNGELERFTYTVSHDLKSPLVTISGFLGFLEKDALAGNMERVRQDSQRIQEAVTKMQRLLTELLELSRIGRMMNPPLEVPFNELIHEAMEIVQGQLKERNITVHIQPDLPIIFGDKPRLIEVMQNLLDNAAKYIGDQPLPTIEIGQHGEERGKPVFYVRDNGIGIAPEHHERIFGLFNKLDVRTEGTGVGLALVKRIIEIHGGRIWVESEPANGSTFLFTLPTQPRPDSVI